METTDEFDIEYADQIMRTLRSDDRKKVLSNLESFFSSAERAELKREAQRNIDNRLAMDIAIRELDAEYDAKKATQSQS